MTTSGYLLALAAVAVAIQGFNDETWWGTVIAFAPKWPFTLPALPLAALWLLQLRRRSKLTLVFAVPCMLAAAWLWSFPIAGLRASLSSSQARPLLRLMTYNVGGIADLDDRRLRAFVEQNEVDVALLQECNVPFDADVWKGWFTQKAFSQCFVSRQPPQDVVVRDPKDFWDKGGSGLMTRYEMSTKAGPLRVVNVHLETPREGFEALRAEKLAGVAKLEAVNEARRQESAEVRRWVGRDWQRLVIAGDFNMLSSSAIFREHFGDLLDAFESAGRGFGSTKVTRWHRVRIDHVLAGGQLEVASVKVLASLGGDHRPTIVEVAEGQ